MYQSVGIVGMLKAFGALVAAVLLTLISMDGGLSAGELIRKISSSVTIAALIFLALGQSPLFPIFCRLPIIRGYFPPIDGEWEVTLDSNWDKIKEMKGIVDGKVTSPVKGKVKIKSRLLFIHIGFDANSRYSGSKTVCVSVNRDPYDSTIKLNYIYENHTPIPEATDSPIHNGAARVTISEDDVNGLTMTGTYWTDRKWTEGMNTAGRITYRRAKKT